MTTQYLAFRMLPSDGKRKTDVWEVLSVSGQYRLALISWHGPWRQYTFRPEPGTIWNKGCLTDVNNFIDKVMTEWREAKKRGL